MRHIGIPLMILFLIFPLGTKAEELNAGIVQGLWYSSPTVFANVPTRIYVALRNNTDKDLSGTIRFRDNEKSIGTAYVNALPGRIVEAWTDWTPSYGEHTITATLYDVKLSSIGVRSEVVEVESTLAEDVLTVDYDTDKDGIGNADDPDDDNDTIPDETEIANGTDPLVATPIAKSDTSSGSSGSSKNDSAEEDTNQSRIPSNVSTRNTTTSGLERYIPEGRVDDLVTNVTDKVNGLKDTLDTYRDERKQEVDTYFEGDSSKASQDNTEGEDATITVTHTSKTEKSFLAKIFDAGKAIIAGIYTLILWMASTILGYPLVVELFLLFLIISIIFRTARKLARRPKGFS